MQTLNPYLTDSSPLIVELGVGDLIRVHERFTSPRLDTVGRVETMAKPFGAREFPSTIRLVDGKLVTLPTYDQQVTLLSKEEQNPEAAAMIMRGIQVFRRTIMDMGHLMEGPLYPIWQVLQCQGATHIPNWFIFAIACDPENPRQLTWAETPDFVDNSKRRRGGRMSRLLQYMVSRGMVIATTRDIERCATLYGDNIYDPKEYTFEIVEGDDLISGYRSGPNSCMKSTDGAHGWGPYYWAQSPKQVKLLKILYKGEYRGRALLWYTDEGEILMDRVYGGNHFTTAATDYAVQQGWDYRHPSERRFMKSDKHNITLQNERVYEETLNGMPYLDTLLWPRYDGWNRETISKPMRLTTRG